MLDTSNPINTMELESSSPSKVVIIKESGLKDCVTEKGFTAGLTQTFMKENFATITDKAMEFIGNIWFHKFVMFLGQ